MKVSAKICTKIFLVLTLLLATATWSRANEAASATFTVSTVSPGVFQYDLTLNDTGTTTIGTFWFSWIPGSGFMPVTSTGISSPAGWSDTVTNGGGAIRWTNSTPLAAGSSVSGFEFDSTLTPTQLEAASTSIPTDPVDTFFIYSGAPFSDRGIPRRGHSGSRAHSRAVHALALLAGSRSGRIRSTLPQANPQRYLGRFLPEGPAAFGPGLSITYSRSPVR